jgi:hypothetical protein
MIVDVHYEIGVKIHYIEIDDLHDQHLSKQEPFRWHPNGQQQHPRGKTL